MFIFKKINREEVDFVCYRLYRNISPSLNEKSAEHILLHLGVYEDVTDNHETNAYVKRPNFDFFVQNIENIAEEKTYLHFDPLFEMTKLKIKKLKSNWVNEFIDKTKNKSFIQSVNDYDKEFLFYRHCPGVFDSMSHCFNVVRYSLDLIEEGKD